MKHPTNRRALVGVIVGHTISVGLEPAAVGMHELGKRDEGLGYRLCRSDSCVDERYALLFLPQIGAISEDAHGVLLLVEPDQLWVNLDRRFQLRQAHLPHPS